MDLVGGETLRHVRHMSHPPHRHSNSHTKFKPAGSLHITKYAGIEASRRFPPLKTSDRLRALPPDLQQLRLTLKKTTNVMRLYKQAETSSS